MTYRVLLWCRDCTGQDPDGCFGGESELLHEKRHPWGVLTFADIEAAKAAGWDATRDAGPWEFEVIDEGDQTVFESGNA